MPHEPTAPTDLILIRHGETAWNRELRFQGHVDVPLNDAGHEQARRLGERMAGEVVQHVIASDLLRTQQTATPAARALNLPIHPRADWREQHFGVAEGLNAQEIQARHPRAWEDWLKFREDHSMPGGESPRVFHARVMAALANAVAQHAGRTVIVVTHGGVLDMIWRTVHNLGLNGPRISQIPNAGYNRIRITDAAQPERIEVLDWADVRHLDGLPPQPVYDQRRHLRSAGASGGSAD